MIKKIIALILLIIVFAANTAFADDGGSIIAGDEKLQVSVKTKTADMQMGGELELQITLQNNDKYPIYFDRIERVFEGCYFSISESQIPLLSKEILPGSVSYFDARVQVPDSIKWYIEDGKYYTNIKLLTGYSASAYDEDNYDYYNNISSQTIPVEISNIKDGSHLVEITVNEELEDYYLHESYEDIWYEDYEYSLCGIIDKTITVKNISGKDIDMICIPDNSRYRQDYNEEEDIFFMAPGSTVVQNVKNIYIVDENEAIPDTLPLVYQAIFLQDGEYYAVQLTYERDVVLPEPPEVEATFYDVQLEGDYGTCKIVLKNPTNESYENFVFSVDNYDNAQELNRYSTLTDINYSGDTTFEPGETIEFPYSYYLGANYLGKVRYGYIYGDYIYTWAIGSSSDRDTGVVQATQYGKNPEMKINPLAKLNKPTATPGYQEAVITPVPSITSVSKEPVIVIEKTGQGAAVPMWAYCAAAFMLIVIAAILIYVKKREAENKNNEP